MKLLIIFKSIFFKTLSVLYSRKSNFLSCKVNGICKFNGKELFGENINFNGSKIYGQGIVTFGDNFHSAEGLRILTSFHDYKGDRIPYNQKVVIKNVTIEDNVWFGLNVIILGGVTIGEGSIIQAGAVVVRDVPKYSICGGNPASVFAKRNIDHYEVLKKRKRFL